MYFLIVHHIIVSNWIVFKTEGGLETIKLLFGCPLFAPLKTMTKSLRYFQKNNSPEDQSVFQHDRQCLNIL